MSKTAFVLANSAHGALIVNRFDYGLSYGDKLTGIGAEILENGVYNPTEVEMFSDLLTERRKHVGKGIVVLDCGANYGVFTLEFAHLMRGWGQVVAIEAQERLFYALCGNIALQNAFNARAIWAAVDAQEGFIDIPEPNYCAAGNFGEFELKENLGNPDIGQDIDYSKPTKRVRTVRIDDCGLDRIDLIKLDVEGMEIDALVGATETLKRCRPMIYMEILKVDPDQLKHFFTGFDYQLFQHGAMNVLAMHEKDPMIHSIKVEKEAA